MIRDVHPLLQATLGGLFTWGLTALGSAAVFLCRSQNKKLLDASLGFAAGVMTAASFWSLLAPGIERAELQMAQANVPEWVACLPVAIGFILGAGFVWLADFVLPFLGFSSDDMVAAFISNQEPPERQPSNRTSDKVQLELKRRQSQEQNDAHQAALDGDSNAVRNRKSKLVQRDASSESRKLNDMSDDEERSQHLQSLALSWRRVVLLIIAITVHNVPEGLAVGVGFGAINKSPSATFANAVSLAMGIGIQNFPEGMAVSLPLVAFGYSKWRAFIYGQLSGIVEPVAALIGAAIVTIAEPVLPYALSFAAGAMIYVVVDDIVPEAQMHGNGRLASWSAIIGFIVMMCLDVALG